MKKNYGPDPRCIGGRNLIIQDLYNHHNKLINAKPSMKIKAPK